MTPQELKNSILQLAIQGKLVEQRPEEGTAEELYQQIQAEKQALIKAGKIKKEKSLAENTEDEIPFEIPESWKWVRLGSITSIEAGGTPDRNIPEYWGGKIPWVKIGDITSKNITTTSEYITQKGLDNSSAKVFPPKTLLFTIFATIGTVGILQINAATNQAIAGITLFADTNIDYIYYVCVGLRFLLVAQAHGMAQMNINQKILKNTPIPLPPLREQKRIVAKLEELLPLVDRYEKAWTRLEDFNKRFPGDMQKSILQMAIQGKLVEQRPEEGTGEELYQQIQAEKQALIKAGKIKKEKPLADITEDEIPFEIPESWKWVRLRAICDTDISYGIIKLGDEDPDGVKVLRCSDVKENYISPDYVRTVAKDLSNQFERTVLNGGEIVINVRGTLGGCAVVPYSMKNYNVAREVAVIRQRPEIEAQYIVYILMSRYFQSFMFQGLRGIAYKGLNMGILSTLPIPLPPLAEQKRIVAKLEELLPLCERLS